MPLFEYNEWGKYSACINLRAKPMTRAAYNSFRGWDTPADENGADEGYITEHRSGHISWMPKDIFEWDFFVD